jgi:hypothetical protein
VTNDFQKKKIADKLIYIAREQIAEETPHPNAQYSKKLGIQAGWKQLKGLASSKFLLKI